MKWDFSQNIGFNFLKHFVINRGTQVLWFMPLRWPWRPWLTVAHKQKLKLYERNYPSLETPIKIRRSPEINPNLLTVVHTIYTHQQMRTKQCKSVVGPTATNEGIVETNAHAPIRHPHQYPSLAYSNESQLADRPTGNLVGKFEKIHVSCWATMVDGKQKCAVGTPRNCIITGKQSVKKK